MGFGMIEAAIRIILDGSELFGGVFLMLGWIAVIGIFIAQARRDR